MKASRPYLIRALNEWIVDNQFTPYLLVDANYPDVKVPREHVNGNGNIILNITSVAVDNLALTNTHVSFSARFARGYFECHIPIPAVLAIYANENGKGMFFNEQDLGDVDTTESGTSGSTSGKSKPHLTLVKS